MKNKKTKTILTISVLLAIMLLSLTACSSINFSNPFKKTNTGSLTMENFRKGSDAISIEFLPNSPPEAVFVKDKFNIAFMIKNLGAYDITDGTVTLVGFEQSAWKFQNTPPTQTFTIPGRSQYLSQGGEDVITFPVQSECFPGYSGTTASARLNYSSNFKAIACFGYQTIADATICIDPVRVRTAGEKPECTPKPVTFSGGQGGPVGVTSINVGVVPYGNDVNAEITISLTKLNNKVSIYSSQSPNKCFSADTLNKVELEVMLSGQAVQCNANQIEIHSSGDSVVKCTKALPPDVVTGAFTAPVSVKLTYLASQSAIKSILVSPPPGQNVECANAGATTGVGNTGGSAGATGNACTNAHPGFSCKDISSSCPDASLDCLSSIGCFKGLCPGAATIVCCP